MKTHAFERRTICSPTACASSLREPSARSPRLELQRSFYLGPNFPNLPRSRDLSLAAPYGNDPIKRRRTLVPLSLSRTTQSKGMRFNSETGFSSRDLRSCSAPRGRSPSIHSTNQEDRPHGTGQELGCWIRTRQRALCAPDGFRALDITDETRCNFADLSVASADRDPGRIEPWRSRMIDGEPRTAGNGDGYGA